MHQFIIIVVILSAAQFLNVNLVSIFDEASKEELKIVELDNYDISGKNNFDLLIWLVQFFLFYLFIQQYHQQQNRHHQQQQQQQNRHHQQQQQQQNHQNHHQLKQIHRLLLSRHQKQQ